MFKNIRDISLKTSIDVFHIRKSCLIAEKTLHHLGQYITPGISTRQLDLIASDFIQKQGAKPALKGYKGFPGAICTSINEVAAHGIPSGQILQEGDIITIDTTVSLEGWYGDAAWSYLVGQCDARIIKLIKAAWQVNLAGILAVKPGGKLGDIGYYISKTARKFGCTILEDFGGHGIGRKMHEDPIIPHIGKKGMGMCIVPGMVFTIEPMLTLGKAGTRIEKDGWAIKTQDKALTAQFENTIAVFKDRIEILTFSKKIDKKSIDYPPDF